MIVYGTRVRCDACGAATVPIEDTRANGGAARGAARRDGWRLLRLRDGRGLLKHRDLCPKCKEAA